jgi:CheY-like chemotaxis protein
VDVIRLLFACQALYSLLFRLDCGTAFRLEIPPYRSPGGAARPRYTARATLGKLAVAEVGILIFDDDIASQRALKHILDSEGWRVRVVPDASHAFMELASSHWSLVIVNAALIDLRGPLFGMLKELAQAEPVRKPGGGAATGDATASMIRVLFLVPPGMDSNVQVMLEQEALPYALKPCHLHDFLEKVSELLVDGGAIARPLRSISDSFGGKKRHKDSRFSRDAGSGTMFASREDYQMTEEEMIEFEQQEETERKKRQKKLQSLGGG